MGTILRCWHLGLICWFRQKAKRGMLRNIRLSPVDVLLPRAVVRSLAFFITAYLGFGAAKIGSDSLHLIGVLGDLLLSRMVFAWAVGRTRAL
jgi:hypothetical protein